MKAIYKHLLKINEVHQTVQLPLNSTILSIQNQNESAILWAIVDIDEIKTTTVMVMLGIALPYPIRTHIHPSLNW